ncbi:hypothetical protein GcC1_136002 [Golovinomyces cichoracearum]|uniref:Uncharacterized protein n=1 Tax=Golovinomyces cichoracearum TaxID=62708 RepID=A0A420I2E1_9PEZI|nr:hypothetical protein GcC1_136002 [Golovinomyces cichoracearum]
MSEGNWAIACDPKNRIFKEDKSGVLRRPVRSSYELSERLDTTIFLHFFSETYSQRRESDIGPSISCEFMNRFLETEARTLYCIGKSLCASMNFCIHASSSPKEKNFTTAVKSYYTHSVSKKNL